MIGYTTVPKPSNDFRDWGIEPETGVGDIDANDHPSSVCRGSTANWLTLARAGYGVKQKADMTGKSGVFATPDYVAFFAVLRRGLRSVRNGGAALG